MNEQQGIDLLTGIIDDTDRAIEAENIILKSSLKKKGILRLAGAFNTFLGLQQ